MPSPTPRRLNSLFAASGRKQRRPAGVSRRRKKQLGFETLEDRRVMAADLPFDAGVLGSQTATYSSATPEGQLESMLREMYWQSLIAANASTTSADISGYLTESVPTDPLLGNQWHLINSGQQVGNPDFQPIYGVAGEDINVAGAWNLGYTGAGVTVAVIDRGVQLNHPDLADNINLQLAFDAAFPNGTGNPPDFYNPVNAHGTAVAGLIGAIANNGIGGAGVAPGVTLVPIQLIGGGFTSQDVVDAFRHAIQDIDITNNSWGSPVARDIANPLAAPTPEQLLAIRDSIVFGRDGKGVIHVVSAGNNAGTVWQAPGFPNPGELDSASYNGWRNSRYFIAVTGVDHDGFYNNVDGTHTGYPETSSAILVAAPTGSNIPAQIIGNDTGIGSGIWTTDLTGDFGFNQDPDPITGQEFDRDFLDDSIIPNAADFTSRFNGTSAAAPLVSGVIALMLEANPDLTWRDVQEILVRSARQNAPLAVPSNGFEQGHEVDGTQNLWIINQTPVFHDPDPYFIGSPVSPTRLIYFPTLDPNITANPGVREDPTDPDDWVMHYQPTPIVMTNGAGYTVSMGRGTGYEQIGYGHGVVDAEMAVRLAEQWHTKGQALPGELTFTTYVSTGGNEYEEGIPAAERGNDDTGNILVPGGLGGSAGFIDFWNEYFADEPFSAEEGPENTRGAPLFLSVPDSNAMSVESVEVKVSIAGGTAAVMDHLRILLVSPDGTHSEMTHYFIEPQGDVSLQNSSPITAIRAGSAVDNGGDFIWTFSTKRSWGERADDAIVFDPVTGEPVINTTGINPLSGAFPPGSDIGTIGEALRQGWQLHFENYGTTPFTLNGVEVVWHGSPVVAESQRVQGFVGIDDNRDDLFNYSRVIQTVSNLAGDDPNVIRYSEVKAIVDPNLESFAGNVTVTARRTSDNVVVDQFVTGHDGNFYFDLVPDDYIISIEDPAGRVAQDDTITGSGFLDKYKSEWHITPEHFKVWSKLAGNPNQTPVDANGVPIPWVDGTGNTQVYGMKGINFLLDPGDAPVNEVEFTGRIYADTNGDGAYNGSDIYMPGVTVFGDVNRNGVRDAGEVTATTAANGQYTLVVPVISGAVMNVGVIRPTNWTSTNDGPSTDDSATDGIETFFVQPGAEFAGVNFAIKPGASGVGGGGVNQPGIILGTVFEDANGNAVRDTADKGAPNFTVYIDANNNGVLDFGDTSTVTNENGAYVFTNVAPGQRIIRMVTTSPNQQTTPGTNSPGNNTPRIVQLVGSSTVHTGTTFGVQNTAFYDYGDLPDEPGRYEGLTAGPNAARHRKGAYYLGQRVDGELGGIPSDDAKGDDDFGMPDEDGVDFGAGFVAGDSVQIVVNASRNNGKLQLWIDWDDDGSFAQPGDRILTNELLYTGDNYITIDVPATAKPQVYARFRYGNADLGLGGEANIGEVEDYRIDVAHPVVYAGNGLQTDSNQDGFVDGTDFLNWQRNVSRTTGATMEQGDATFDGRVNQLDLNVWKQDYGATVAAATGGSSGSSTASALATGQTGLGSSLPEIEPTIYRYFAPIVATPSPLAASGGESDGSSTGAPSIVESAASSFALFGGGPFVDLSARQAVAGDRVAQAFERIQQRLAGADEYFRTASDRVVERLEKLDPDFLRRDRAFEDLIGSRRRQGLKAEADFDVADDGDQADEAFAAIANHFEWRRG